MTQQTTSGKLPSYVVILDGHETAITGRREMSTLSNLRKSRDTWKQKAVERGERIRSQRKEHRRLKHDRDQYKQRAQHAAKEPTVQWMFCYEIPVYRGVRE